MKKRFSLLISIFLVLSILLFIKPVSPQTPLPDLIVTSIELSNWNPSVGENVLINISIKNIGTATVSGAVNWVLRVSLDGNFFDGVHATSDILPGQEILALSRLRNFETVGLHNMIAVIDWDNRHLELNEENNAMSVFINVSFPDADSDGIQDRLDNCPYSYNLDQNDADMVIDYGTCIGGMAGMCGMMHMGYCSNDPSRRCDCNSECVILAASDGGDACDNCWYVVNPGQEDSNSNCPFPPYTSDPQCGNACEVVADADNDNIPDEQDICPSDPTNTCIEDAAQQLVTASTGGTLTTPNGEASLTIPPGALTEDTIITITSNETNFAVIIDGGSGTAIMTYELKPVGQTFASPVTIVFTYNESEVNDENLLDIYWYNLTNEMWEAQNAVLDITANTLTLTTDHFSNFAIIEFICIDNDVDGYAIEGGKCGAIDCDDNNAEINPTASESCNNVDDNCNGIIDEEIIDIITDMYGYDNIGECRIQIERCISGGWQITQNAIAPTAELCDNLDNDCDSVIDEGVKLTFYQDVDSDGYGNVAAPIQTCTAPSGYVSNSNDCSDNNAAINPGASDANCNNIDDDCDGVVDNDYIPTVTTCGYDLCLNTGLLVCENGQLIDSCVPAPSATVYRDSDGDEFGNSIGSEEVCTILEGYVLQNEDCDDNDAFVNPLGTDICDVNNNVINKDCNPDDDIELNCQEYCGDTDRDGYVTDEKWGEWNGFFPSIICPWVKDKGDCNDYDALIYLGAPELCDGKDNNCNSAIDDNNEDSDEDGVYECQDQCPGTTSDYGMVLSPGSYADIEGDGIFEWNAGNAKRADIIKSSVTLADTGGCSCRQILEQCKPGNNKGECMNGCTGGPFGLGNSGTIMLWRNQQGWAQDCRCSQENNCRLCSSY